MQSCTARKLNREEKIYLHFLKLFLFFELFPDQTKRFTLIIYIIFSTKFCYLNYQNRTSILTKNNA